jgi:hypothetical protein
MERLVAVESEAAGGANKDRNMLWKVFGSTLALGAFAVACLAGLIQGHSFASCIRQALLALAAGGVAGLGLAFVVRSVVTEDFRRKNPAPAAASAGERKPAAGSGRPAEAQAGEKRSGTEVAANRSAARGPGTAGSRN